MSDLKKYGIEVGLFIAGLFGSILSLRKLPKKLPWLMRAIHVASGCITAGYLTPLVSEFLRPGSAIAFSIAFFIGYVGLQIVDMLWEQVSKIKLLDFLKRK